MLSNKEVSGIFKLLAGLMELHGENDFKAKSYANTAFQLGRVSGHVMKMTLQELESLQGIGKSGAAKIIELQQTGTMQVLENLMQLTPPGILEIMQIKGIGGKKVAVIWKELGVESAGELLYACYENRLSKLKGFGEKTQQSVIQSIEYYQSNLGKFRHATIAAEADALVEILRTTFQTDKVSLCGAMRRKCNIAEGIEILGSKSHISSTAFSALAFIKAEQISDDRITCRTLSEVPAIIYLCAEEDYYKELFIRTGSEGHVSKVLSQITQPDTIYHSEEQIYKAAGMHYVLPELREEGLNFLAINQDALISDEHIKGVVHNHSTWSDGKNTVGEMANACIENGYAYLVMSDHSKTAIYAGGLTEEQIVSQQIEIDSLNNKLAPFKIFKSIECDILNDGSMDYNNDILKTFDLVIASIHQNLKMDEEKATARLLKAIENPYVTILGHMTGRLILSRPGYPVDHKKIIDACAANHVVIEINANPYRLDIDHTWIPYALERGVMISVNPDAHSIEGIADIHWGVTSARKGGLTRQMTWNAMTLSEVEHWLTEQKKKKQTL